MQEIFDRYISYLRAEKNASEYTIRNYASDLLGNYVRGPEKGFIQFLRKNNVSSLADVDRQTIRDYIAWLMEKGIVKSSIARKLSAIRSFCRFLVQEEILSGNTLEKASAPNPRLRVRCGY